MGVPAEQCKCRCAAGRFTLEPVVFCTTAGLSESTSRATQGAWVHWVVTDGSWRDTLGRHAQPLRKLADIIVSAACVQWRFDLSPYH